MSDTNFLREIEEEVRRDRLMKIWERYQTPIVAAAVLIVLATAAWRGWQWYQARENMQAGSRFEQALALSQDNKQADSEKMLAGIAKDAPSSYRAFASLRLAGEKGRQDPQAGVQAFDEIAANSSIDPVLRDVARLRAVLLLVDSASPDEIGKRIEPLTGAGKPFRNSARDALALAYYRAGDKTNARKIYAELAADPEMPPALANRVQIMMQLTAEGGTPPVPPASPEKAAAPAK